MEVDHIKVLLAVLVIWGVVIATCVFAARRDKRAPADDIGVMWLIILALYATLPPLSWLVQGGMYSAISFQRLVKLQPTSDEVLQLMYVGVAYACGFAGVYAILRRSVPEPHAYTHAKINNQQMVAALLFVLVYITLTSGLRAGGYVRSAESYADSYLAIQELPLGLRQALKIAAGFARVAQLVLVVALLQRWPRTRSLFMIYLGMLVLTYDPSGSRRAVLIGFLSAAMAWHILIRPINGRWWVGGGAFGLVLFMVMGILRGIGMFEDGSEEIAVEDGMEGVGLGELDALWANAVNLLQEGSAKLDISTAARYGEFWQFIPSQMLPFEKVALNDWYIKTFFPQYAEQGGGWEFGALSQAVIGGGAVEAAFRGAGVAVLSAWLMKWYRSPTATWWRLPLYLYLLTLAYLSIRDTTFRPLTEFTQLGICSILFIEFIAELLANMSRPTKVTCPSPSLAPDAVGK